MNEAALVSKLKASTLAALPPPAVFFKHHDGSTAGVPDCSVNHERATWWIEVKYVRPGSSVAREIGKHPLQLATMQMLKLATSRALYVVYHDHGRKRFTTTLWCPFILEHEIKSGFASPVPRAMYAMPHEALTFTGGIQVDGFDHALLARVMRQR